MEDKTFYTHVDGQFIEIPDINKLCLMLKGKFENVYDENLRLKEENQNLKSGQWKIDKEKEMLEEYNRMKEDYYRGFPISKEEKEAISKWMEKYKDRKIGAIGGAFTYKFTPTSIGTSGVIVGPDGDEFEFQEIG